MVCLRSEHKLYVCVVLMSSRRLTDYVKVFTAIVELVSEITGEPPTVDYIMMEFESANNNCNKY